MSVQAFRVLVLVPFAALSVLGCGSDVHAPISTSESRLDVGAACVIPTGGDGTDTQQCPYYACYCKGGTEPVLCTDYCAAESPGASPTCQDQATACAFECRNAGGVDHSAVATPSVCD